MTRCVCTKTRLALVLAGLLTLTASLSAQVAASPRQLPARGYDRTHEITLNGIIHSVITKSAPGSPVGLHLLVTGENGMTDAHVGPYLNQQTRHALHAGIPVQIIGSMETVHGKSYLLARQLIFSGRLVTVRSMNGFLMASEAPAANKAEKMAQAEGNGGAR